MELAAFIRDIEDFPEAGVVFKDITPLLNDPKALRAACKALLDFIGDRKVDKVEGVDSRGFIFAPMLAEKLGAGFVPIRKMGKLPDASLSQSYEPQYGQETLEIHTDAIKKGELDLVHDDVLATGGSAEAVCKLVERLGGEVVQCNFLVEINPWKGQKNFKDAPLSPC